MCEMAAIWSEIVVMEFYTNIYKGLISEIWDEMHIQVGVHGQCLCCCSHKNGGVTECITSYPGT